MFVHNRAKLLAIAKSALRKSVLQCSCSPEFEVLSKELERYYNNFVNDQSLTVPDISESTPCVVEHYDKYHRVIIKRHENESKVLVKLIDSGAEIVVDAPELLRINSK